jgi:putative membrane protein
MKTFTFLASYRWKFLVLRILINAVALIFIAVFLPSINFGSATIARILFVGLVLGILNAVLKPILQFLTLPFLFVSYGLVLVVINALLLYVLAFIFPDVFVVNTLLGALAGGLLLGLISSFLENIAGLPRPILGDNEDELRKRVDKVDDIKLASFLFPKSESPLEILPGPELLTAAEAPIPVTDGGPAATADQAAHDISSPPVGESETEPPGVLNQQEAATAANGGPAEGVLSSGGQTETLKSDEELPAIVELLAADGSSTNVESAPRVRKTKKTPAKTSEESPVEPSQAAEDAQSKEGEP